MSFLVKCSLHQHLSPLQRARRQNKHATKRSRPYLPLGGPIIAPGIDEPYWVYLLRLVHLAICIHTSRRISETLDIVLRRSRSKSINTERKEGDRYCRIVSRPRLQPAWGSYYRILRAEDGILLSDGFKGLVDEGGATQLLICSKQDVDIVGILSKALSSCQ